MADSADAISNCFELVFVRAEEAEDKRGIIFISKLIFIYCLEILLINLIILIGMCWFHMRKAANEKL